MALSTQRAAVTCAETDGQINRRLLPLHLPLPFISIRVGEVGRETHHRRFLPGGLDQPGDGVDIDRRETAKEPVVMLDPFPSEKRSVSDPSLEGRLPGYKFVELEFRKHTDTGRHLGGL